MQDICLQICSLRESLFEDVPKALHKIAEIGYTQIELARYMNGAIRNIPVHQFYAMAQDVGLKIISSHIDPPYKEYNTNAGKQKINDYWKLAVEHHQNIGLKYLIMPLLPAVNNIEDALKFADILNELGYITNDGGLQFAYHNHEFEFYRVSEESTKGILNRRYKEGTQIYDILLDNTDPKLVTFQMDVFWTVMGQNDPLHYLKNYPDRMKLLHLRDEGILGQSGIMNFERILQYAYLNNIHDICVEMGQLNDEYSQFEGVKDCFRYLLQSNFIHQ